MRRIAAARAGCLFILVCAGRPIELIL
eukprot:COSAG06_NODE_67127_length_252_cov_1.653595_1_plen_26_part_01